MAGVTDTVFRRLVRNASFVQSAREVMEAPLAVFDIEQPHPTTASGAKLH